MVVPAGALLGSAGQLRYPSHSGSALYGAGERTRLASDDNEPSERGDGTFDALLLEVARSESREPPRGAEATFTGRVLDGKYEILRPIGKGGMGAVYEARHGATGRRVAVKVIAIDRVAPSASTVQRFEREARAAGAIDSPYIAQILDAGADAISGEPDLVMELLAGEDLYAAGRRMPRFAPELALRVTTQACLGLESAHAAGVIHRDIKPANLFLARREGEIVVKLLDFGIAKMTRDIAGSARLTESGVVQGSPRYMSPEQALGGRALDHRTDIWSLGVVLYELLAGALPYDVRDASEMLAKLCAIPARPLRELAPWVSSELTRRSSTALSRAIPLHPLRLRDRDESGVGRAAAWRACARRDDVSTARRVPFTPAGGRRDERRAPVAVAARHERRSRGRPLGTARDPPRLPRLRRNRRARPGRTRACLAGERQSPRADGGHEGDAPRRSGAALPLPAGRPALTARLQHRRSSLSYELGVRSDGAPFYTMKLVAGERLDVEIDRAGSLDGRLALLPSLLAVAEAVAFAHEHRIIHRDLKPANVIIGAFGEAVVIDWGLAKDLSDPSPGAGGDVAVKTEGERATAGGESRSPGALATAPAFEPGSDGARTGHAAGTLAYMPPEQFRGESVDERADVFSLGASLYHLIVEEPPRLMKPPGRRRRRSRRRPVDRGARARRSEGPGRHRPEGDGAARGGSVFDGARPGGLDLRRFQTGQLVGAHHYSLRVLLRRWVARHKRGVTTTLVVAATLAVLGSLGVARVVRERNRAEAARARADGEHEAAVVARRAAEERATRLTILQAEASLDRDPTAAIAWLKTYPEDGAEWDRLPSIAAAAESRGVARRVLGVPRERWSESARDLAR